MILILSLILIGGLLYFLGPSPAPSTAIQKEEIVYLDENEFWALDGMEQEKTVPLSIEKQPVKSIQKTTRLRDTTNQQQQRKKAVKKRRKRRKIAKKSQQINR
ncbi:hypothetical protein [Aureispira anguillae]|uniref:Uncharacterized protein n=1 Tax=Aureispira anguillae TaxID=2864201 RepID=A0A915YD77_9BACT|nr:hypothetical protein [Aureispira anguillae]BDS10908.1 hypothetical protein AsAng_0016180 [Aureispira anguillae]